MAVSMIAESSAGNAKVKSEKRITASSTQPRRADASRPSATPKPMPMPTAMRPTAIELRAPTISSETTSRPRLSVPSQWLAPGSSRRCGTSISVAECGVQTVESAAVAIRSSTSAPPMAKLRWCRARRSRDSAMAGLQPRVDYHVEHVDDEVDDDDRRRQQHHDVSHDAEIAVGDRLEDEPAEAWQREHVLDDDRAGEQVRELQ